MYVYMCMYMCISNLMIFDVYIYKHAYIINKHIIIAIQKKMCRLANARG